jgi:putative ABC transport system permease protein
MLSVLPDLHLNPEFNDAGVKYLAIFPFVAALILLLALVNYISLSTARATLRAKEIGVRKITGATRKGLFVQFYLESALYALLAFALAYILCSVMVAWLIARLRLNIDISFFYNPELTYSVLALFLITVLLAGIYPSLVLSSLKPATSLKGSGDKRSGGYIVRKVFTTLQFTIAVALIICGVVIDRQLFFLTTKDTGIDRENVISVKIPSTFGYNYQAFKHDVQSLAGVEEMATARLPIYSKYYDSSTAPVPNSTETITVNDMQVDEEFFSVLNVKWKYKPEVMAKLAGLNSVIINETAAAQLQLGANPVGKKIKIWQTDQTVAGVVKDFTYQSMEAAIKPLTFIMIPQDTKGWGGSGGNAFVKVKPNTNMRTLLTALKTNYVKYDNETPFEFSFLDEDFKAQYQAEDRLASIFTFFTCTAILLAVLGLFGLTAFTIQQRVKEIGIRKVLGASIASINKLLSIEFLKLVVLAIVIASPFAWWVMNTWLQGFVYRIAVPWWVFVLAAVIAIVISMLTISYNAIKAAVTNPVKSLRSE